MSALRPLRLWRDKRTLPGNDGRPTNAENVHEYDGHHGHTDHPRPGDDVRVDARHPDGYGGCDDYVYDDSDSYAYDGSVAYNSDRKGYDDHSFDDNPDGYDYGFSHHHDYGGYGGYGGYAYGGSVAYNSDSEGYDNLPADFDSHEHDADDHVHNFDDFDHHLASDHDFDGDFDHLDHFDHFDHLDHLDHRPTYDDFDDDHNCR